MWTNHHSFMEGRGGTPPTPKHEKILSFPLIIPKCYVCYSGNAFYSATLSFRMFIFPLTPLIHSKHSRHYNFVQGPLVKMSKFYALHFPLIWTPWILFYFSSHGGIYMFGGKFNRYSGWGPGELRYSWLLNLGNGSWLRPVSTPVWVFAESFMLRACLHFSWHKKNNF